MAHNSTGNWNLFSKGKIIQDDDIALLSQITLIIFNVIMILGMSVSFTLASLTYLSIRRAAALSQNDRSMQMTLLIAVSAQVWDWQYENNWSNQTFVPFVCIYICTYWLCICTYWLCHSLMFLFPYSLIIRHFSMRSFPLSMQLWVYPWWDHTGKDYYSCSE